MKRFVLIISALLVFFPAIVFAAPSTDLTVGYDTDNFDEGTCQLRLRVVAHFFYDTLNFCGIGGACDVTTGEITVTGQGSPYVLVSNQRQDTLIDCPPPYGDPPSESTFTQVYLVPPDVKLNVLARIRKTCSGVTQYYATESRDMQMQSLNEDGDAYTICGGEDCNDGDPAIHAGAVEICDGIDNDCDGIIDNSGVDQDADGSDACLDCDDNDPSKKTGEDLDGDGVDSCTDCNDDPATGDLAQSLQASIIGGATVTGVEVCNQKDDNCNGRVDENIDNNSCTFCGLKAAGTPVNFMSGAKTTLPQRDFLLKGINGFDLDFYRLYSNQVREEVPQALKTVVRGNVSDSNIHTVLVNGSPASVINGVWQKEVTLTPGANTITATAEIEGIPLQDTADVTAVPTSRHSLGAGWTHSFNLSLSIGGDGTVSIQSPNGRDINFYPDGQGGYLSINGARSTLVPQMDGSFRWIEGDGKTYTFNGDGFLTQISDRFSNIVMLSYQSNRLTTITDTTGRQLTLSYNASGNLEHIDGPAGQLASHSYDASGNLSTATNNAGEVTTYIYQDPNDPHNLTSIQNDAGQTVLNVQYDTLDRAIAVDVGAGGANGLSISYDAPRQTTVTNLEGGVTVYEYSYDPVNGSGSITTTGAGCSTCGGGNVASEVFGPNYTLTSATDRNGNASTYTYDSRGNVLTKTEAYGTPQQRTTTYTWHPDFNFVLTETVTSVLDPQDVRRITYDYDDDSNATSNENPGLSIRRQVVEGLTRNGSGALIPFQQITYFDYDSLGRLIEVDGPRTGVTDTTTLTYYPIVSADPKSGMLESITRTNGTTSLTTTYDSYDANGNVTQITDPNAQITTYTYDAMNHVNTITQQGATTTFTYDANGNIDVVTLPNGNHIDYVYDSANRLTQINDDLGNRIQYAYDTQGNRTREERKDPSGVIKTYLDMQYDTLNRLDRVTNPDSSYTAYDYDPNGNRTGLTDPNGNITSYEYDPLNRMDRMTQPGSISTILNDDSQDHIIGVSDGNGNTTTYEYDDAGRVVKLISPDTGTTRYAYDAAGNLASRLDANGILVTYTYDALNRLTHIAFPDSSQDITYSYDGATGNGLGRLTGMADPSGTTTYSYTNKGQLYQEVKTFTGLSGSFTTTYSYDGNGNLTGITYPSGRQVTYAVDSANQITEVSGSHGGPPMTYATLSSYLPYGPYQSISLGNGLSTTLAYDNRYQFDGQTVGTSPQLLSHDYAHNANGNVTSITDLINSAKNKTYGYDALDRLTSATGPWPSSGSLSYSYDSVGNRLTEGGSLGSSTFSYTDNLLTDITGTKNKTFSYDANGNAITENNLAFIYNQDNRLVQVTENSVTLGTYIYDGQGRRVKKVSGGQTSYFLYDQQSRLIAEADGSGDVVTEYLYLPDRPLSKIDIDGVSEEVYYYHTDHLWTPLFMTDNTGQKVWSAELLPFGEGWEINEDVDGDQVHVVNNLRFPGQYYDAETGLHYNVMRHYHPQIGRYAQSDPIGLAGGINTFAYALSNPMNEIDPLGLYSWDEFMNDWADVADIRVAQQYWQDYGGVVGSVMSGLISYSGLDTVQESAETLGDSCKSTGQKVWAGAKIAGVGVSWYLGIRGPQYSLGEDIAIAPAGHRAWRTGWEPVRVYQTPHYHRRVFGPNGKVISGQGKRWHRPWEKGF